LESLNSAHKLLEFLLTKTAITSKPTKSHIRIPYKDLLAAIGQKTDKNIDLIVKFDLSWDDAQVEDELLIDEVFEDEYED
jgi:hypothetical protein